MTSAPFGFAVQPFQEQEEVEQNHETATDFENSLLSSASSSRSPRIKYTVQQLLALSKSPLSRKKPSFSNPIPEEILFEENARRTLLSSSPSLRGRGRGIPRGAKRYITSESRFPPRRETSEEEIKRGKGGRTAAWFVEPIPEDVPILDETANLSESELKRRKEFEEWRKKFNNTAEQSQQPEEQYFKSAEHTHQLPQQHPVSNFFDGFGDFDETAGSGVDDLFTKISLKKKANSGGSKFFPTEMKEDIEEDRTISELIDVDDHLPSYAQAETEESILSSYGSLPQAEFNGNSHNSSSILNLLKGHGASSFEQPAPTPNGGDFTDASSLEAEFLQGYTNNEGITEAYGEKQSGFNAQSFFKQYENQYGPADPLMSVLQQQQPQIQNPLAELMPSYYPPQSMPYNQYQYHSEPYVYQDMGQSSGNMYNMQPEMYSEQSLLAQLNAQPPQEIQPQPVKKAAPKQKKTSLVPTQMLMYQGKTYNDLKTKTTKASPAATKKEAPVQKQPLPTQNPFLNAKAMGAIPSLEQVEQSFLGK